MSTPAMSFAKIEKDQYDEEIKSNLDLYFGEPYTHKDYSPIKNNLVATSISPMKRQVSGQPGIIKPIGDISSMDRSYNIGSISSAIADLDVYKDQGLSHPTDKFSFRRDATIQD